MTDYDNPEQVRKYVQKIRGFKAEEHERHRNCLARYDRCLGYVQEKCPHANKERTQGDVSGTPQTFCSACGKVLEVGFGPLWETAKPEFNWEETK